MTLLDKPYGTGDEFQRFLKVGVIDNGEEIRSILIPFVAIDESDGSWADVIAQLLTSIDLALPDELAGDGGLKVHVLNPGSGSSFEVGEVDQGEPGTDEGSWWVRLQSDERAFIEAVRNRFDVSIGSSLVNPVSTPGDTIVYTPDVGNRVRLKWVGLSTPDSNGANVTVKWRFGSGDYFWHWIMGKPGAFAHGAVREGGVDESLKINLSAGQPVTVAFDVEEF